MIRLLSLFVIVGAWANQARLVDPGLLKRPVTARDPLAVPKRLWRAGARGPLFYVDGENEGFYFLPENWDEVALTRAPGILFLHDRPLLKRVKAFVAEGNHVLVQARIPNGGFAVNTDNQFFREVAPVVPQLSAGPYVGINGFTHGFLFEHEVTHHEDHSSRFADDLWADIKRDFGGRVPVGTPLEPIYYFIIEARALDRELTALEKATRAFEYAGTPWSDESTVIHRFAGAAYREGRRAGLIRSWNRHYAAALDIYSGRVRHLARAYFRAHIADFALLFDAADRVRPACERALVVARREEDATGS